MFAEPQVAGTVEGDATFDSTSFEAVGLVAAFGLCQYIDSEYDRKRAGAAYVAVGD